MTLLVHIIIFIIRLLIFASIIAEFSPYLLYKYLIYVYPPLTSYYGRMWIYLIVGILYLSPELNIDDVFNMTVYNKSSSIDSDPSKTNNSFIAKDALNHTNTFYSQNSNNEGNYSNFIYDDINITTPHHIDFSDQSIDNSYGDYLQIESSSNMHSLNNEDNDSKDSNDISQASSVKSTFFDAITDKDLIPEFTYKWKDYFASDYFDYSFFIGVLLIAVSVCCYLLDREIYSNIKLQENQIMILSKNYDDFRENSIRESLNYMANNNSGTYSNTYNSNIYPFYNSSGIFNKKVSFKNKNESNNVNNGLKNELIVRFLKNNNSSDSKYSKISKNSSSNEKNRSNNKDIINSDNYDIVDVEKLKNSSEFYL